MTARSDKFKILTAFAAIYVIWGSTYLAIRFAVESLPPFTMTGVRFMLGGLMLYIWARQRGADKPTKINWRSTAIAGTLMMFGGTGLVAWAEESVPSGLAALMIGAVPFWIVLFDWISPGRVKPTLSMVAGLILGFVGLGLLVGPSQILGVRVIEPVGAIILVAATFFWAAGSVYSRYGNLPESRTLTAGMEMMCGGLVLVVAGGVTGEFSGFDLQAVTPKAIWAFVYLTTVGSLAFACYTYLLKASTPSKAATYAYVNPVIAILLGILLADEVFSPRSAIAMVFIVSAVAIITTIKGRPTSDTTEKYDRSSGSPRRLESLKPAVAIECGERGPSETDKYE